MNRTKIEWVKNPDGSQGYTWNPITGCLNGCSYCYAKKLANGRLRERYLANKNVAIERPPEGHCLSAVKLADAVANPFYPRFWPKRCLELDVTMNLKSITMGDATYEEKLVADKFKPKGIFVCDMSDLFGIGIPEGWQESIFNIFKMNPWHRFYLLTKQPQNLAKWSPFPDNCWVGVTATDSKMAWNGFADLAEISASIKYLSIEPLLEELDTRMFDNFKGIINQVIIGAQTKPIVYPKIEWVREIVEACDRAKIPVFLKDNLKPLFPNVAKYGGWRQELPE